MFTTTTTPEAPPGDLESRITSAVDAAASAAEAVDREGRFPQEAFDRLRRDRLLSAPMSRANGGGGLDFAAVVEVTRRLGRACGSTGLTYAMHAGQVICLDRHAAAGGPELTALVRRIADEELLVASSTTELGIGGDVRRSSCHVAVDGDRIVLEKNAPVVSYGENADVVLVTARRGPDAAPGDQVLVACPADDLTLERTSGWDTTGFRGTCSMGYVLTARTAADHVLPVPYAEISARTMLPASHVLWAAAWLGIADAARDGARRAVTAAIRRSKGAPGGSATLRLAELTATWQKLVGVVDHGVSLVAALEADHDLAERAGFTMMVNSIKVNASELVAEIAVDALRIVGINGYRRDHAASLDRVVRDALGAALMVNNDRILGNNAGLSLMDRGDLR